jgi:hypothetical protein
MNGAASAAAQFWGKCMPKFNWRSLDDTYYDQIEQAEMTGMAWECLRRSASFERDYQTIHSSGRSISDGFRQHWGLVFRSRPRTILSRADYLLGSRGRADDYTGPSSIVGRLAYARQARSQRAERKPIPPRSGWLARRIASARRRASYLVQGSANRLRRLYCRTAARPRFRIQGGRRYAFVARAQWTAAGRAFARHFSASPATNCTCLACVGCMDRRRDLLGNR